MSDRTCKQRWAEHKNSRMSDLRKLWRAYQNGDEDVPDLGSIFDYGLSFDYVAPGTSHAQRRGYWRYQISWGGPSEEFRFYGDAAGSLDRIEFVFLDWFDGCTRKLRGRDEELLSDLWQWFVDCGSVESEYRKAVEG